MLLTTDEFLTDAKLSAADHGMPSMRAVGLPAKTYYRYRGNADEARPVAAAALDEIVAALTAPLTPLEANPKPDPTVARIQRLFEVADQ